MMMDLRGDDERIRKLLKEAKTVAVVGLSPRLERPSNMVAAYLISQGYEVIPVNPGHSEILGRTCYPELRSIPGKIDIVDIFRRAEDVVPIVEQAVEIGAGSIWMQQGIVNEEAAELAGNAGMTVIMDRCIKVDHSQLICG